MTDKTAETQKLILLKEWNKYYSYPCESTLRKLVFNKERNGFDKVIRKIGSRILLSVDDYFNWVDETNGIKREV